VRIELEVPIREIKKQNTSRFTQSREKPSEMEGKVMRTFGTAEYLNLASRETKATVTLCGFASLSMVARRRMLNVVLVCEVSVQDL
jgi:hypothetical protein